MITHVGKVLRAKRRAAGLTQFQLAERIDMSRFSTNQIERNKRALTPAMALRLEHAFCDKGLAIFLLTIQLAEDVKEMRVEIADELAKIDSRIAS